MSTTKLTLTLGEATIVLEHDGEAVAPVAPSVPVAETKRTTTPTPKVEKPAKSAKSAKSAKPSAKEVLAEGRKLVDEGRLSEAVALYEGRGWDATKSDRRLKAFVNGEAVEAPQPDVPQPKAPQSAKPKQSPTRCTKCNKIRSADMAKPCKGCIPQLIADESAKLEAKVAADTAKRQEAQFAEATAPKGPDTATVASSTGPVKAAKLSTTQRKAVAAAADTQDRLLDTYGVSPVTAKLFGGTKRTAKSAMARMDEAELLCVWLELTTIDESPLMADEAEGFVTQVASLVELADDMSAVESIG